ncbi:MULTISPECIES: hypothetical protein [unclassified Streptomyces]|uniref:hypothetical protein n=1 Tax=unclassified Streptomyces TaxID=2593676 RepID=UPI00039D01AE|nr:MULTISPECIES: hypothetical protein [unclassified Streptomyces]
MLTEIDKLLAVRAIGLPRDLFIDVAPKVVAGWRARAAVESPSHLRTHPVVLRVTLLAALLGARLNLAVASVPGPRIPADQAARSTVGNA